MLDPALAVVLIGVFVALIAIGFWVVTARGARRTDNSTARTIRQVSSPSTSLVARSEQVKVPPTRLRPKRSHATGTPRTFSRLPAKVAVNREEVSGEIYLDIETKRLSSEVAGGWSNIEAFGLAIAVTWDLENSFRSWIEGQAAELIAELQKFERIVTYNGDRFDIRVLAAYGAVSELSTRSFDVLAHIRNVTGHLVALDHLASHTLGARKTGNGIAAVRWWREGKIEKVAMYCCHDVELLLRLVAFARQNGHVVIDGREVKVAWSPLEVPLTRRAQVVQQSV